ncbi:MAG: nickel-dependent lactate racemase [Deltaproteobacteria bacterium]|jgi:nickel-dependent lactate racemase|nr:nickel-dependent lactate racemase [Deltaproteobacteria bacterium]
MVKITLKYGHGTLQAALNDDNFGGWLIPKSLAAAKPAEELVRSALEFPVGTPKLSELLKPGEKVAIVTSDITRPCPSAAILPGVLSEVARAGVPDCDVVIVLALGIHRSHSPEEASKLVGPEVYKRYRVIDHDPCRCRLLGTTSRGTPIDVFEEVANADRRIALGNVEYHYFAGYSGGVKAILPGVSSHQAIRNNHSMMVLPNARAGVLDGNPVREDLEELTNHLSLDFIVNVVLGEDKTIRAAFAGHHRLAHRKACQALDAFSQAVVPAPGADVILVSAGGFPKDINVYQAQKALDNAAKAVRPGGVIVWVGACEEGFGEAVFERWLNEAANPKDLIERVKADFELGGHKAAAIALVLQRCDVFLVSKLPEATAEKLFVKPFHDLDGALKAALDRVGPGGKVLVMPYGGSTLPELVPAA